LYEGYYSRAYSKKALCGGPPLFVKSDIMAPQRRLVSQHGAPYEKLLEAFRDTRGEESFSKKPFAGQRKTLKAKTWPNPR